LGEATGLIGTELGAVGEIGPLELTPVDTSPLPGGPRGGSHWPTAE
jgi:hypothetical protein